MDRMRLRVLHPSPGPGHYAARQRDADAGPLTPSGATPSCRVQWLGAGRKSLGYTLTFGAPDRTLTME